MPSDKHKEGLCNCKSADKCPYWHDVLRSANLSMERGSSARMISLVGNSRNLEMVDERAYLRELGYSREAVEIKKGSA